MAVEAFELFKNDLQFVFGDARAAIPYLQAQFAVATANAQQHRSLGIAEGIGEEVLQHTAQQLDVAVDPQSRAPYPEFEALFLGQYLELGAEGIEQLIEGEWIAVRVDLAVLQSGNA